MQLDVREEETFPTGPKRLAFDLAGHILRILAVLTALAVLALFSGFLLMLRVGHWLVKQDDLQKADAIAVLSGGFPARALEAAVLYRAGYAKEIWLTKPGSEWPLLREMDIHYPSEADFSYRVLVRQGIPAQSIHILPEPVGNTADEVDVINGALLAKNDTSVIIVTEKAHTRRVHMLWNRLGPPHGAAIVHGVADDGFDPNSWWNHTEDTQQVIHEMMSLVNLWAGMPVRTRVHEQAAFARHDQAASAGSHRPPAPDPADPIEQE